MSDLLEAALNYAERGWHVIPLHSLVDGQCSCKRDCRNPGKHPHITKWPDKANTDPNTIRQWWKLWPYANIGLVCGQKSGLVVIDIDPRNGGDKSLQNLIDSYPEFESILATYTIKTGGDGQHFYYSHDKPFKSVKKHGLGDGIDIKADDGYVLAPPSNHHSGGVYAVENDVELLPLPPILIDLISQHQPDENEPETVTEGNRNNWLAEQAARFLREKKSSKKLEQSLQEKNIRHCVPPLEHGEVSSIARSLSARFKPDAGNQSFKTQWQIAVTRAKVKGKFAQVLNGLSHFMNNDGGDCFPTQEELADVLNVTIKTVREHIKTAEELGFLVRYKCSRKGKKGFHHGYVAKIPEI